MSKLTKIVATIGPVSDSEGTIEALILAGVNVFRFNMKHGTVDWHEERIARVQAVANKLHMAIGILIDLQGPEIRLKTKDGLPVTVAKGEEVTFTSDSASSEKIISIPHEVVFRNLSRGDMLLIDDGFLEFEIIRKKGNTVVAVAMEDYVISNNKGVNLPGKHIDLPSLVDEDLNRLDLASRAKVDFVALSFSRTKKDIEILRNAMEKRQLNAMIVAKIESQQALDHLDELIESSDAVMVARGDLGIEVPIEQLAFWQEQIVSKCRKLYKPVIVATQMLQSMIENPRPTRAEATDVANAIFDGTDAIMLSGETASGKFPVKAVSAMSRIAAFNEGKSFIPPIEFEVENNTQMIVRAASDMLSNSSLPIETVLVFTQTGYTARVLSSFRPKTNIIAITNQQKTVEELSLSFGVYAFKADFPTGEFSIPKAILIQLKRHKLIHSGNTVLVIHGHHWKKPGLTNALKLIEI